MFFISPAHCISPARHVYYSDRGRFEFIIRIRKREHGRTAMPDENFVEIVENYLDIKPSKML